MKLALLVIALLGVAQASHFRYGTISWVPFKPTTVQFRVDTAWKRSYWTGSGLPADNPTDTGVAAGDVFEVPQGNKGNSFYYGDGESKLLRVEVTSPTGVQDCTKDANGIDVCVPNKDYTDDQALGVSQGSDLRKFYPSVAPGTVDGTGQNDPWTAGFKGCCRLGARSEGDPSNNPDGQSTENGLNNNGFRSWDLQTTVYLQAGPNGQLDNSPRAAGKAILRLRMDYLERFDIIAIDPDERDELTWRLGTSREMGGNELEMNKQPGWGLNTKRNSEEPLDDKNKLIMATKLANSEKPNKKTVTIRYGEAEWDTNQLNTGYWQSTIMVETGPNVKIPYDFLILLNDPQGNDRPIWIAPTPGIADQREVTCPGEQLKYYMVASDPQDGADGKHQDAVSINSVTTRPQTMNVQNKYPDSVEPGTVFGDPTQSFPNPVSLMVTWQPSCAHTQIYIQCYQPEDNNDVQPLEGRVRCVVIRVIQVTNTAPYFCGNTPEQNAKVPVCVGKTVQFTVEVCDDNDDDVVTIDFINKPEKTEIGDNDYAFTGTGRENVVRRTFTLFPDQSLKASEVCFWGTDNKEESPGVTEQRCVELTVRYPPRFISPTPMPTIEEATGEGDPVREEYVSTVKICEETSFEVKAEDQNQEDNVSIFVLEDPGLPNGAVVSANVCPVPTPNAEGVLIYGACYEVRRFFSWTPDKTQGGRSYRVCFIARDNKNFCQAGGYYSLLIHGENLCVQIQVVFPAPRWISPTPTHMNTLLTQFPSSTDFSDDRAGRARLCHVGCLTSFAVRAGDEHYCVKIRPTDANPLPPTALPLECVGLETEATPTIERCDTDLTWSCLFQWTPKRGHEGQTYTTCFHASDNICNRVLHDGNLQSDLPDLAHASAVDGVPNVPLCIPLSVVRCRYCVQEGDTLHYLNKYYHLDTNWLRLWNSNGNDDRVDGANLASDPDLTTTIHDPDLILHADDVINVGPVYKVQVGDTLVGLAARFHTTVRKIMSVNPDLGSFDDYANDVQPGQELCVMPCTDAPNSDHVTYTYAY